MVQTIYQPTEILKLPRKLFLDSIHCAKSHLEIVLITDEQGSASGPEAQFTAWNETSV